MSTLAHDPEAGPSGRALRALLREQAQIAAELDALATQMDRDLDGLVAQVADERRYADVLTPVATVSLSPVELVDTPDATVLAIRPDWRHDRRSTRRTLTAYRTAHTMQRAVA